MPETASLFLEERRQAILDRLNRDGRVAVADLSHKFGVSEVTIRADLQILADHGLVVRTHGGAVPTGRLAELSLNLRREQRTAEKDRIGAAGAALVADGDAVFLDASSTALALAWHLRQRSHVTIITNSLAVTQSMLDAPGLTVVMTGGILQRETVSLIGAAGLEMLRQFNIKKGFFGAHGLSFPQGLTDVSVTEAELKHQVVGMCHEVIAVLDATKWGQVGLASFAHPDEIRRVITEKQAPVALVRQARAAGMDVVQV